MRSLVDNTQNLIVTIIFPFKALPQQRIRDNSTVTDCNVICDQGWYIYYVTYITYYDVGYMLII